MNKKNDNKWTKSTCEFCQKFFTHYKKQKRRFCNIQCALKGNHILQKGNKVGEPWNKGKKHPKASGSKNGNWNGGSSNVLKVKEKLAGRKRPQICDVCYKKCKPDWDHCHTTGLFRGWLCRSCNLVLGMVKDNPKTLKRLAIYLDIQSEVTRPKSITETLI